MAPAAKRFSRSALAMVDVYKRQIYTSSNLKDWKYESHVTGFWECPELFELPVDGDKNHTKWVMYGATAVSYTHLDVYKRQGLQRYTFGWTGDCGNGDDVLQGWE